MSVVEISSRTSITGFPEEDCIICDSQRVIYKSMLKVHNYETRLSQINHDKDIHYINQIRWSEQFDFFC